jgi:hypothetical protein
MTRPMFIRSLAAGIALAGLLTGCSTIHGQGPLGPNVGERVGTLQPTLRWEPVVGTDVTYDLVVARAISTEAFRPDTEDSYYREGLKEPEHRLERSLLPGQRYYWSVRVRRGGDVTGWSNYDHWVFWVVGKTTTYGLHYHFTTPAMTSSVAAGPSD